MSYLKFDGHYVERLPGGINVGCVTSSVTLGRSTVELPIPYIPIGNNLGITPTITPDGETALRIDFTRWSPLRYGHDGGAKFPFNFDSQELAVKVGRAFDADPATSWGWSRDEIKTWLFAWGADRGISFA